MERDPDHKQSLIAHFPNLKELDCVQINQPRVAIKDCRNLKQHLIPFLLKLEALAKRLSGGTNDKEYTEIIEVIDSVPIAKAQK